jgi:putative hydrolase of the HAD superfamily
MKGIDVESKDRIKAVFFDAADTLFHIKGGVGNQYWNVAKKYGADSTPGIIEKAFSRAFKSTPPLAFADVSPEERKLCEKKWWYEVVRNVFSEVGMFERFDDYFDELFETFRSKAWELFPETKEVLSHLKTRGLILGIISNFDTRVYDVCTDLGIIDYFDSFVISSEAGFSKPSPEIFSLALSKSKVSPSECIHIGDSLEHDFYGANSVGIRVILLDKKGKYKSRNDVHRIESLTDVIGFVDGDG